MVNLPAVCDSCGTVFKSGFSFSGGGTVVSIGSSSGPCPNCGGFGHIPDGTYKIIENIIEVLSAPQRTLDELERLSELLKDSKENKITNEELNDKTEEEIPGLHPLLDFVIPRTRSDRFNFGMMVLSVALPIFISAMLNGQTTNNIEPEVIINNFYGVEQNKNESIRTEKIKRNELCPCGSRIKYKRCHGW